MTTTMLYFGSITVMVSLLKELVQLMDKASCGGLENFSRRTCTPDHISLDISLVEILKSEMF